MPEDIEDKMNDFELMLEGFVFSSIESVVPKEKRTRILQYWYSLSSELIKLYSDKK